MNTSAKERLQRACPTKAKYADISSAQSLGTTAFECFDSKGIPTSITFHLCLRLGFIQAYW
ncbi:hypothetical protein GPLA_4589 [Paraglaciecola polaris LMG 21857]|uniref:Uncharacterized protein n=1 Tax=Paraglaciecola polaris LMG 21857 TaxID=1129793 RepID=K7A3I4_9ALTE|nr:hypothetical protein GPLA_4589 [Paraglaciecola polaris LMG 21857]